MAVNDQKPLDEQEEGSMLEFTDEDGNIERFEFLDMISYNGSDYAVLLPEAEAEKEVPDNVYIFEVIEELDSDTDTYVGIDDDAVIAAVYELFMKKHADDINFVD